MSAVPLPKRHPYNELLNAVLCMSSVLGPLLGGAFTSNVSFPIGGAAMLTIYFVLKPMPAMAPGLTLRQQLANLDLLAEQFLFPSLFCLSLVLQRGGSTYDWNSWRTTLLLVLFRLCLMAFITTEILRQEAANIQLRVMKYRSVVSAMWYMLCLASTMCLLIYCLPSWLQAIEGKSAVQSGMDTLPLVISLVVAFTLSGQACRPSRILHSVYSTMLSSCLMPIGIGLISIFKVDTRTGSWIRYRINHDIGIGLGLQHGPVAVRTVLQRMDLPMGVSLVFSCQQLGGVVFVSVGHKGLNTKLIAGLCSIVKDVDPQIIVNTDVTVLPAVPFIYNEALGCLFVVGVVMASLCALSWLHIRAWVSFVEVEERQGQAGPDER